MSDTNKKRLSAELSMLDNSGDPITTALVIAYELMSHRIDEVTYQRGQIDAQAKPGNADTKPAQRITLEQRIAAELGHLANVILERASRHSNEKRQEPDDFTPGCYEPPGTSCDFPGHDHDGP